MSVSRNRLAACEVKYMDQVKKEFRICESDAWRKLLSTTSVAIDIRFTALRTMGACVLIAIHELGRDDYRNMYEILKIIEDREFWLDVSYEYSRILRLPFSDPRYTLAHAEKMYQIYCRHGFQNLEPILLHENRKHK